MGGGSKIRLRILYSEEICIQTHKKRYPPDRTDRETRSGTKDRGTDRRGEIETGGKHTSKDISATDSQDGQSRVDIRTKILV